MKARSAAAMVAVLSASMAAFAAQTQEQPSSQSYPRQNAAPAAYQQQDLNAWESAGATSIDAGDATCQLKREAIKDVASSTVFAATAAQDGISEVALAGLALRKSNDSQLRQLALTMVQDYSRYNGGLASIVSCKGLLLPAQLDAKHNALIARFNQKSGRTFEKAYLKHVAEKRSAALFEAGRMLSDPDLAAFARQGLSMFQEHRVLADNLRIGTTVASTH